VMDPRVAHQVATSCAWSECDSAVRRCRRGHLGAQDRRPQGHRGLRRQRGCSRGPCASRGPSLVQGVGARPRKTRASWSRASPTCSSSSPVAVAGAR
jgi:hypothetical protein